MEPPNNTQFVLKAPHSKTPYNTILDELNAMLREMHREIAAYGRTRSLSHDVFKDLLEETRTTHMEHDSK